MERFLRKYLLLLVLILTILPAGIAQADTIALSTSGGSSWVWPAATIGWEFTVAETITVTSLGVLDGEGMTEDHQVGIWTSFGGALLTSTTVTSADPLTDGFRYQSISPVTLQAGTYVIGCYMPGSGDIGLSETSYSTNSPVTYTKNLYLYDEGFTVPTIEWEGYDGGNFGPNFQFVLGSGPEPTSIPTLSEWGMIFMSLILAGSALWMIRRRRATD